MTAGLWHQADEDLGIGAKDARPAVSVAWPLGNGPKAREVWLDMYDGPRGRDAVAVPEGDLGGDSLARLSEVLMQARRCGVGRMWIDFSHVGHVDYRAIPGFLEPLRQWENEGGTFALVGISSYLSEIFRAAGVELTEIPGGNGGAVCGAAPSAGTDPFPVATWTAPPRSVRSARPGPGE